MPKKQSDFISTDEPAFNTTEGILGYLARGLEGLHQLVRERVEAVHEGASLGTFIVLGRFCASESGGFDPCKFETHYGYQVSRDASETLSGILPKVVRLETMHEHYKDLNLTVSRGPFPILPPHDGVCDECKTGWALENCHDAVLSGDNFLHVECSVARRERDELQFYGDVMKKAGLLPRVAILPIENQYDRADPLSPPWISAKTFAGNIVVGARRHVYSIDWSDIAEKRIKKLHYLERGPARKELSADRIFPAENVTKDGFLIHAWDKPKLVEYLSKIAEAVGIPLSDESR